MYYNYISYSSFTYYNYISYSSFTYYIITILVIAVLYTITILVIAVLRTIREFINAIFNKTHSRSSLSKFYSTHFSFTFCIFRTWISLLTNLFCGILLTSRTHFFLHPQCPRHETKPRVGKFHSTFLSYLLVLRSVRGRDDFTLRVWHPRKVNAEGKRSRSGKMCQTHRRKLDSRRHRGENSKSRLGKSIHRFRVNAVRRRCSSRQ